jgi:hypothetical protein
MPMLPDPRHEKIAQALARGTGVGDSYAAAGYKRNAVAASKFCAKPEIKARVFEIRALRDKLALEHEIKTSADVAREFGITKKKILESLWAVAQSCLKGAPILKDGKPTGEYTGKIDAAGASRALELIGRESYNMFVGKFEIGAEGAFSRMSDTELAERIATDAAELGLDPDSMESLLAMFTGNGVQH